MPSINNYLRHHSAAFATVTILTLACATNASAQELPAPHPGPLGPGDTASFHPRPGVVAPGGLIPIGGGPRGGWTMPPDCVITALHVDHTNVVRVISTAGESFAKSKPIGVLPSSWQTGTVDNVWQDPKDGQWVADLWGVDIHGALLRVKHKYDAEQDNSSKPIKVTQVARVGQVNAVTSHLSRVFVLTAQTPGSTSRLVRYDANDNAAAVRNPTKLGTGSWDAIKTITTRSEVAITAKGTTTNWDQIRGVTTTGDLVEIRATQDAKPQTTAKAIVKSTWDDYEHIIAGSCPITSTYPMMAVSRTTMQLWRDVNAQDPRPDSLRRLGSESLYNLPEGNIIG